MSELTEGKEYTFRVKALNESGEGPPTELTVIAKDQFGKDRKCLSPVVMVTVKFEKRKTFSYLYNP